MGEGGARPTPKLGDELAGKEFLGGRVPKPTFPNHAESPLTTRVRRLCRHLTSPPSTHTGGRNVLNVNFYFAFSDEDFTDLPKAFRNFLFFL